MTKQAIKDFLPHKAMAEQRWQDTLAALNSVQSNELIDEAEVSAWLGSWGIKDKKKEYFHD